MVAKVKQAARSPWTGVLAVLASMIATELWSRYEAREDRKVQIERTEEASRAEWERLVDAISKLDQRIDDNGKVIGEIRIVVERNATSIEYLNRGRRRESREVAGTAREVLKGVPMVPKKTRIELPSYDAMKGETNASR